MSSARRKEKLKAGLDGLFSKPAAKTPAVQPEVPVLADPPLPQEEFAPVKTPPAPVKNDPVDFVEPVEIIPEPEPAPPEIIVELDPPPVIDIDIPDEPPAPQPSPPASRPAYHKTNGYSNYDHEFMNEEQVVVFTLGEEHYAVDIAVVESIIKMEEITAVPNAPKCVEGVVNLRGLVMPVLDLRTRLEMPRIPPTKETRIVVVEINDSAVGCVVDAVTEVLRIPESRIEPTSALMLAADSAFIRGIAKIGERLIILIDLSKLLVL